MTAAATGYPTAYMNIPVYRFTHLLSPKTLFIGRFLLCESGLLSALSIVAIVQKNLKTGRNVGISA